MWARIETHDPERLNDVAELIDFDPEGMFHPDLIWKPVPEWLVPYIDTSYWWDEATQTFEDMTGYQALLHKARKKQHALFDAAFAALDSKKARATAAITEMLALGEPASLEDVNILGQINMISEENRSIRKGIDAIVLPHPATPQALENVLADLAKIIPWLPGGRL